MTKKINLIVHIGAGKTGSSVIQGFLDANRQTLAHEFGVLYPNLKGKKPILKNYFNHAPFFNKDWEEKFSQKKEIFQNALNFCKKNNIHSLLLSWENTGQEFLTRLMSIIKPSEFKISIVVYLRRQDSWLESAWKQWGHKSKAYKDILDYSKNQPVDWYNKLLPWQSAFGKENIIVRIYESSSLKKGIIHDFLSVINVNTEFEGFVPATNDYKNLNTGFKKNVMHVLEMSKTLHKHQHDNSIFKFLHENLDPQFRKPPFQNYGYFSKKQREEILNKYATSNAKVAKEYLNSEDGILFNDPIENNSETMDQNETVIEEIVPVIMSLLLNQHRKIMHMQKDLENLQAHQAILKKPLSGSYRFVLVEGKKQKKDFGQELPFVFSGSRPKINLILQLSKNDFNNVIIRLSSEKATQCQLLWLQASGSNKNTIIVPLKVGENILEIKNQGFKSNRLRLIFEGNNLKYSILNCKLL